MLRPNEPNHFQWPSAIQTIYRGRRGNFRLEGEFLGAEPISPNYN